MKKYRASFTHSFSAPFILCLAVQVALGLGAGSARAADEPKDDGDAAPTNAHKYELRAVGGFDFDSYSLAGAGFSANLAAKTGFFYGADAFFRPNQTIYSFKASYRLLQTTYAGLTGFSPSSVLLTRQQITGAVMFQAFADNSRKFLQPIKLGVGYSYFTRTAPLTTPNAILATSNQSGLSLLASYSHPIAGDFSYDFDGQFDLPNAFSETNTSTGAPSSSYNGEASISIVYAVSQFVDVSAGVFFRYEKVNYEGTGSRGTTNGAESQTTYGMPFTFRVHF